MSYFLQRYDRTRGQYQTLLYWTSQVKDGFQNACQAAEEANQGIGYFFVWVTDMEGNQYDPATGERFPDMPHELTEKVLKFGERYSMGLGKLGDALK